MASQQLRVHTLARVQIFASENNFPLRRMRGTSIPLFYKFDTRANELVESFIVEVASQISIGIICLRDQFVVAWVQKLKKVSTTRCVPSNAHRKKKKKVATK